MLEAFSNSTHIAVTDRTAYYYCQNDTGAMKKFFKDPTTDIIVAADKIIQYIDTHQNLSSECYDSLEKAQAFCANRYQSKKVDELTYEGNGCVYNIIILNVK